MTSALRGYPKPADISRSVALHEDHGTSEQFHSVFKTDLDIERLPSGKFDTNGLVLAFADFAYSILRFIRLIGLTGEAAPFSTRPRAGA